MCCSLLENPIIERKAYSVLGFVAPGAPIEILDNADVKAVVSAAVGSQLLAEGNSLGKAFVTRYWSESEMARAKWGSFRWPGPRA